MFRYLCILAMVPFLALGQLQSLVEKCENGFPLPIELSLNDCTALPCTIVNSAALNIAVTFRSYTDSDYFFPSLFAQLDDEEDRRYFEFPAEYQLGCNFLAEGEECPLTIGSNYHYSASIPFETELPAGTGFDAQFTLYDSNESSYICFKIPVVIE